MDSQGHDLNCVDSQVRMFKLPPNITSVFQPLERERERGRERKRERERERGRGEGEGGRERERERDEMPSIVPT